MKIILIPHIVYSKDRCSDMRFVDLEKRMKKVETREREKKRKKHQRLHGEADKNKMKENKIFVPILHRKKFI